MQNSGTVAQGWRTDTYRALVDGGTDNMHILSFDYRGFGHSSGVPSEAGILIDGIAAVNWAMGVANIPPERILIFGQSLGTYVASAVAEHFARQEIEFAGLVLVAGFTDLPTLLSSYAIAGYIPILAPLKKYQRIVDFLNSFLVDTWPTAERLREYVKVSQRVRLSIIHALDDMEIPWFHSNGLFAAAFEGSAAGVLEAQHFQEVKSQNTIDTGNGTFVTTWNDGENRIIRQQVIGFGGELIPKRG